VSERKGKRIIINDTVSTTSKYRSHNHHRRRLDYPRANNTRQRQRRRCCSYSLLLLQYQPHHQRLAASSAGYFHMSQVHHLTLHRSHKTKMLVASTCDQTKNDDDAGTDDGANDVRRTLLPLLLRVHCSCASVGTTAACSGTCPLYEVGKN